MKKINNVLIIGIFVIFLIYFSPFISSDEAKGCCETLKDGSSCGEASKQDCVEGANYALGASCSTITFCNPGWGVGPGEMALWGTCSF